MGFTALEISRQKGQPITLFLFVYEGSLQDSPPTTSYYAYTDAEQPVLHDGITYEPVPVLRDGITATGNLDKSALSIKFPKDIELTSLFQIYPPTQPVSLVIRQGHANDVDDEFLVIWAGRVLSIGREQNEVVLSAEPLSSSLRRPGLRRHYQIGCPHVLYGPQCRADEIAATVTGTVSSIDGIEITMTAGWQGAFDREKFTDGMIKWPNNTGGIEVRRILSVNGDVLLVSGFLRDLVASDSISVILGCNHQHSNPVSGPDEGDCEELHQNSQNYGGCRWIPTKNPVGLRNQYY